MRHHFSLMLSLFLISAAPACAQQTNDPVEPGQPIVLLDGADMSAFDQIGVSNWRLEDGTLVADAGQGASYMVSKERFRDFKLIVEFYASDDANSGVFLRCQDAGRITDRTCYEVNIFDQRPDPSYGTGAIVLHTEIDPMPKAGGRWNTYEITAIGRDITAVLNGTVTAQLRSGLHADGFIALQHAGGVIKFRKVTFRPLSP